MELPSAVIIHGETYHLKEGKIGSRYRFVLVDRHGLVASHLRSYSTRIKVETKIANNSVNNEGINVGFGPGLEIDRDISQ